MSRASGTKSATRAGVTTTIDDSAKQMQQLRHLMEEFRASYDEKTRDLTQTYQTCLA